MLIIQQAAVSAPVRHVHRRGFPDGSGDPIRAGARARNLFLAAFSKLKVVPTFPIDKTIVGFPECRDGIVFFGPHEKTRKNLLIFEW